MASKSYILEDSKYCRDCGGPATRKWLESYCENTEPKAVCKRLSNEKRNFCEHCGKPSPGPERCKSCYRFPVDYPGWYLDVLGKQVPTIPALIIVAVAIGLGIFVGSVFETGPTRRAAAFPEVRRHEGAVPSFNRRPEVHPPRHPHDKLPGLVIAGTIFALVQAYFWYLRRHQGEKRAKGREQAPSQRNPIVEQTQEPIRLAADRLPPEEFESKDRSKAGLKPCPDCNQRVSRLAPVCPKCGRPLAADTSVTLPTANNLPGTAIAVCIYAVALCPALWLLELFSILWAQPLYRAGSTHIFLEAVLSWLYLVVQFFAMVFLLLGAFRLYNGKRYGIVLLLGGFGTSIFTAVATGVISGVINGTAPQSAFSEIPVSDAEARAFFVRGVIGTASLIFEIGAFVWLYWNSRAFNLGAMQSRLR